MDDNNNDNPITKKTVRKKLVDLKAVAALLEDGEAPSRSLYTPREDLIQETARIKSQRDLVLQRMSKMEQNRNRVSKNVFDKVYRDYTMQMNAVGDLLNEKKEFLDQELKNLYSIREKQNVEMTRHKEILEEAQFRHFLSEFTEEQYKEVEEYEAKEISYLQNELAKIHSFIKVHEELFDPQELGRPISPPPPRSEIPATEAAMPEPSVTTPRVPSYPEATRVMPPSQRMNDLSEKTPLPPSTSVETVIRDDSRADLADNFDFESLLEPNDVSGEAGYFQPEPSTPIPSRTEAPVPKEKSLTAKTSVGVSATTPKPDSIPDILGSNSLTPKPTPSPSTESYKLVFLEGAPENMSEFVLGENVSIGRSPSNDVIFPAPKVSRQHAAINKYKDKYILIDLKSSNGVFVNGKKVDEHTLEDGDEISISGFRMAFKKI